MTSEEMREALKVLVRNKEEIEVLKNDLDKELTEVKLLNESLKLEVNKLKEDLNNTRESNTHQSQGLERYSPFTITCTLAVNTVSNTLQ